ncbi:TetR/AcrR family transcriptional regulator [Sphingomonas antarctica]|uniref:TetR/AcrR family transcriptional regulator n=1 Tax=Sphingomonas antarctica TaxID=2040274 RepID=UPI0039ED7BB9
MSSRPPLVTTRERLLEAATDSIRNRGFAATSVDDLCAAVGVTKGAFFHHFKSKEALGIAVAARWGEIGKQLIDLVHGTTPRDRVLAYLDLRSQLIEGGTDEFSCLAGTLAQEVHISHPAIRDAAAQAIETTAATVEPDLAAALTDAGRKGVSPTGLALHIQAVLQGAYVVAKAKNDAGAARDSVAHLKRYVAMLLEGEKK